MYNNGVSYAGYLWLTGQHDTIDAWYDFFKLATGTDGELRGIDKANASRIYRYARYCNDYRADLARVRDYARACAVSRDASVQA